MSNLSTWKF